MRKARARREAGASQKQFGTRLLVVEGECDSGGFYHLFPPLRKMEGWDPSRAGSGLVPWLPEHPDLSTELKAWELLKAGEQKGAMESHIPG